MIVLGIDPGLKSGWALVSVEPKFRLVAHGVVDLDRCAPTNLITELNAADDIVVTIIEQQYVGKNPKTSLRLAQSAGRWEEAVKVAGLAPKWVMPSDWQSKMLTGLISRRRASRDELKKASRACCLMRWGKHLQTDEADASMIAAYGAEKFYMETKLGGKL